MWTPTTITPPSLKSIASLEALPTELMSLIINVSDGNRNAVLDAPDVFNLRSSNRRIRHSSFDAFAQRFFTKRKHMLSHASLQCLLNIANDPTLGNYVREVAIGPERVNSELRKFVQHLSGEDQEHWMRAFEPKHKRLCKKQKELDASGEAVQMLKKALQTFEKLHHVRIDTYPSEHDTQGWYQSWGARSILRDVGHRWFRNPGWPGARYMLVDDMNNARDRPSPYGTVLSALDGIKDRKGWTLEIALHMLGLRYDSEPFKVHDSAHSWDMVRGRVRAITLMRTTTFSRMRVLEIDWIVAFVRSCSNLAALTLDKEQNPGYMLRTTELPGLRYITIRSSMITDTAFKTFLEKYAETLEGIVCQDAYLRIATGEEEEHRYKADELTWLARIAQMTTMPRLKEVRFANLIQDILRTESLECVLGEDASVALVGGTSMVAVGGDMALKLDCVVQEAYTISRPVEHYPPHLDQVQVWFPRGF